MCYGPSTVVWARNIAVDKMINMDECLLGFPSNEENDDKIGEIYSMLYSDN